MDPAKPVGVGIVGLSATGGWASLAHVPALAALDGYELRALSASSPESARAAADKYDVPAVCAGVDELVRLDEVDLVVVAVKVPEHREIILAALDAGKSVYCEWPLGCDLAETQELAGRAEAAGVRTIVGLQARFAPSVRYVRDLVADGYVGRVLSTTIVASAFNWGATFTSRSTYQLDRANGATMLSIPFAHTVDALAMVLGELTEINATLATRRPRVKDAETGRVAQMNAEDQIAVTGVLEGGAVACIHFRGGLSRGTNFLWEINGTDGDLVITSDWAHLQFGSIALRGGRGRAAGLVDLATPAHYERVPGLSDEPAGMAYNVACAYAQLLDDINDGTELAPGFGHALHRHRQLEEIRRRSCR